MHCWLAAQLHLYVCDVTGTIIIMCVIAKLEITVGMVLYNIMRVIRNYSMALAKKERQIYIYIYIYTEKSSASYDYVGSLRSPIITI